MYSLGSISVLMLVMNSLIKVILLNKNKEIEKDLIRSIIIVEKEYDNPMIFLETMS